MKLINPILITLNNTLHIKSDNLEPIEVEEKSATEIMVCHLGFTIFDSKEHRNKIKESLIKGIPLPQELADRIEVRKLTHYTNFESHYKAFLLPSKEDNKLITTYGGESILTKRTYTIEEVERILDETVSPIIKDIFLKKLTT